MRRCACHTMNQMDAKARREVPARRVPDYFRGEPTWPRMCLGVHFSRGPNDPVLRRLCSHARGGAGAHRLGTAAALDTGNDGGYHGPRVKLYGIVLAALGVAPLSFVKSEIHLPKQGRQWLISIK